LSVQFGTHDHWPGRCGDAPALPLSASLAADHARRECLTLYFSCVTTNRLHSGWALKIDGIIRRSSPSLISLGACVDAIWPAPTRPTLTTLPRRSRRVLGRPTRSGWRSSPRPARGSRRATRSSLAPSTMTDHQLDQVEGPQHHPARSRGWAAQARPLPVRKPVLGEGPYSLTVRLSFSYKRQVLPLLLRKGLPRL
jgi:hypothetical protein